MQDLLLGPRSLNFWAFVALTKAMIVLAATWATRSVGAALALGPLGLSVLALAACMYARYHRFRLTARVALALASALALGAGAGLLHISTLAGPDGFSRFGGGVMTGLVIAAENERLTLASPCLTAPFALSETCDGPHHITLVRARWDDAPVQVGEMVRADVTLHSPRYPQNPTSLPPSLPPADLVHARAVGEVSVTPSLSVPLFPSIAAALRAHLAFSAQSGERAAALYAALILGDRTALDPATRRAYQDTGTAHLLAISGFNLALFGFGAYRILLALILLVPALRRRPAPARLAAVLAIAVSVTYTALIVPTDATDRALLAIILTLGLFAAGVETRAPRTLALCFVTALLVDPLALTRAGFQLSFAATLGLILALPATRAAAGFIRESRHFTRPLTRKLASGLAALVITDLYTYLATAPVSLVWFGQASPHALWVNLVAIPWMAFLAFPAGLIHLGVSLLLPPLAELTDIATTLIGVSFETFIIKAGNAIGSQQGPTLPFWLGWPLALLVLAALAGRRRRTALGMSFIAVGTALAFSFHRSPGGLEVHVLDVGHGDAIVIRHPTGSTMVVDTGGGFDDAASRHVAERQLLPALAALGVRRIDVLVITHPDRDHVGAAATLATRLPVDTLWLSPCAADAPAITMLAGVVRGSGGRVVTVSAQAPLDWHGVSLSVLWPLADARLWDGRCDWESNDASLVIKVSHRGRSILLTGDIEADAEAALVARYGDGLRSDVLKVPHHGSRTSSTLPFLEAVSPSAALVSGLPGRRPMPPHAAVLDRYREMGIDLFVTGLDGALVARWEDGELAVASDSGRELRVP